MSRIIVVTSGKGGVGKTTTTCNIAIKLAKKGYSVVVIDADIGLNNVDCVMNIENRVVYDLVDVLMNKCRINEALVQDITYPQLYILSSSRTNLTNNMTLSLEGLTTRLSEIFDFVFIDCPAGIDVGFHRAVSAAREAIVVTTPHISAIRDADKVIGSLASYNIKDISLIVNRVRGDLVMKGEMLGSGEISKALGIKVLGSIPEDDYIAIGDRFGGQRPNSEQAYKLITEGIISGNLRVYDCTKKYRGLIGKLNLFLASRTR